ncbi:hypothetical protein KCTCHS21_12520 [Cohnella abietis]|uniref:histidine kinase n=1 Tax=Cohnella abietis TaxID=2507935 RepID=A0A3T1D173_9BACL|nr:hypothetical protein KCTCHS21_12520 [Cohnella abietis]
MDLRSWDFKENRPLTLDGQWELYPDQLITGQELDDPSLHKISSFIQVPGKWGKALSSSSSESDYGYGSYRLRVLIDQAAGQSFGIYIPSIATSSKLFIDGRPLGRSGQPSSSKETYTSLNNPYSVSFTTDTDEVEIIIQVANYKNPYFGGITQSIKLGSENATNKEAWFSIGMQLTVCIVLLMHVIYVFVLYLIGTRLRALIFFSLLIISMVLLTLLNDDKLLLVWTPLNYDWNIKLGYLSLIGVAVFLLQFILHLLPEYRKIKAFRWYTIISLISALLILCFPVSLTLFLSYKYLFVFILLFPVLVTPALTLHTVLKKEEDAIFLLLGATAITINVGWSTYKAAFWNEMGFYPVDLIVTLLAFAAFWFRRYFRSSEETKILADKLQKTDKLKDDFLANTSHELRNPLHGMVNIAQTVLESEKSSLGEKNTKNLELLINVGRRMSFVLNDLLDIERLKEKGIKLQKTNVRIQAAASGVFDMLRFMTEGKSVTLLNNIPDSFPPVIADENRLIQILFNLLHNAVKFTNEGTISLEAKIINGKAHILIEDSGIGMDHETQQRIFIPYEQGDSGMTSLGNGLGLGLSICKQLVELHGETIWVNSSPDQGSVFTFTLQLSNGSSLEQEINEMITTSPASLVLAETLASSYKDVPTDSISDSKDSLSMEKLSILAVDDDPLNLNILVNVLSPESYTIVTATSGKEALALLDTQEWDLVISDVMMPHMSGYELSQAIRERFSTAELPILLLTARSRSEDIETGFLSGANDYVTKPMDAMELRSRVRALTGLKNSVRQRLRMEAAWLQAQIQPHFLFNTLTAIAALSEIDISRMRSLLQAFGEYLRASFDFKNADQLVPLKHELGLVRSYLYIEKERFEDRLKVNWEVDEKIRLLIPPLSIQPLVENAVRHGIMKRSRGGEITIRINDHEDYAEVVIEDNGVGMSEEIYDYARSGNSDDRSGIGLLNTDRRLKQLYGKGLHIESSPGRGTTICFDVLKRKK